MPKITVIIPTVRAGSALGQCLSSLAKQTFEDFDIVLVSNGKMMHQSELSSDIRPKTRLIVTEENRGYGSACNVGASLTNAGFLLFVNDDTFLQQDCLAELCKSLDENNDIISQPLIFHKYAKQRRVGNPCDAYGAAGLGFYGNCGTGQFYASGASLAMSKIVYDSLGGFDEQLFMYSEDVDLCWRARLLGYKVSAAKTARCVHSGGSSSRDLPHTIKFYYTQRNRIRILIKNYSLREITTRIPIAISLIVAGAFFFDMRSRNVRYVPHALQSFLWNLKMLRNTLCQRYVIQSRRVQNDGAIHKFMSSYPMDLCALKRSILNL